MSLPAHASRSSVALNRLPDAAELSRPYDPLGAAMGTVLGGMEIATNVVKYGAVKNSTRPRSFDVTAC